MSDPNKPASSGLDIAKSFFGGPPHSFLFGRQDQAVVAGMQTRDAVQVGNRVLNDQRAIAKRSATELVRARQGIDQIATNTAGIVPALGMLAHTNAQSFERLAAGFGEGMRSLGDRLYGYEDDRKTVGALVSSGRVDEDEMLMIASYGWLTGEQRAELLNTVPDWKLNIIEQGLVRRHDKKAERALSKKERAYLAKMRRLSSVLPTHIGALGEAAHNGLLQSDVQRGLSKNVRIVRMGISGVVDAVNEGLGIAEQGNALTEQSNALLSTGNTQRAQGLAYAARANEYAARANQLLEAGVMTGVASLEELQGIRSVNRRIEGNTAAIVTNTERTAHFVEASARSLEGIETSSSATAANTAGIHRDTSALVALGAHQLQAAQKAVGLHEEGNADRRYYGEQTLSRLGDLVSTGRESVALQHELRNIAARSLYVLEEGFGGLIDLGEGQLEALQEVNAGLGELQFAAQLQLRVSEAQLASNLRIEETLAGILSQNMRIEAVLEVIRATILMVEDRLIERDRSRNEIDADERYREGLEQLKLGNTDLAMACFEKSLESYSVDYRVYFQRALCYIFNDDLLRAERDLNMAIDIAESKAGAAVVARLRLNLAKLYYADAQVKLAGGDIPGHHARLLDAILEASIVRKEDAEYLEAGFSLAHYLAVGGHYEEALKLILEILPQDPKYFYKFQNVAAFDAIRDELLNTSVIDFASYEGFEARSEANLSIAKDAILYGDVEMAITCIGWLLSENPAFANARRIWEIEEFGVLEERIAGLIVEAIEGEGVRGYEGAYALSALAINYGVERAKFFKAFRQGQREDPAMKEENAAVAVAGLKSIYRDKYEVIALQIHLLNDGSLLWLKKEIK